MDFCQLYEIVVRWTQKVALHFKDINLYSYSVMATQSIVIMPKVRDYHNIIMPLHTIIPLQLLQFSRKNNPKELSGGIPESSIFERQRPFVSYRGSLRAYVISSLHFLAFWVFGNFTLELTFYMLLGKFVESECRG